MTKPRILFACRANAGRSLAAKVLAEHHGGKAVEVFSAGSEPGSTLHPEVVAELDARGLSTEGETPRAFDTEATYDIVVTMGCGETCPAYLGARYEDWPIDDPKGQPAEVVRRIVDEIDRRVRDLVQEATGGRATR